MEITPVHIERGKMMRSIVQDDVARRGLSTEASIESLASFLGISIEAVQLGIALANDADAPAETRIVKCASGASYEV